jgi:hypothetical protein
LDEHEQNLGRIGLDYLKVAAMRPLVLNALGRGFDFEEVEIAAPYRSRSARRRSSVGPDGAATMKRVTLELGGKSPTILLDDAALNEAIPSLS